jgi:hypothetical protein
MCSVRGWAVVVIVLVGIEGAGMAAFYTLCALGIVMISG